MIDANGSGSSCRDNFSTENNLTQHVNGVARRDTLVNNAKLQTTKNKEAEAIWIKDLKKIANDDIYLTEEENNLPHHVNGPHRRDSLVNNAKLQMAKNKEAEAIWIKDLKKIGNDDIYLTEEEILLLSQLQDTDVNNEIIVTNLLFSLTNGLTELPRIIKCVEMCHGQIQHLETRKSKNTNFSLDLVSKISLGKKDLLDLVKSIRRSTEIPVSIISNDKTSFKEIWFPKHVSDLDNCTHVLSKFEPILDSNHPGFKDVVYRTRRAEIANIAFEYKHGQSIPYVQYTDEETKTWGIVYKKLYSLYPKQACTAYREVFKLLETECGYSENAIPQLQDVSMFLKKKTGFTLRPAAGLVSARDFLTSLAFRVFQCTQYVRHCSSPHHTPEPDCIHELLGHVPMLADPAFARFSQEIGLAALGSSDEDIEKLSTLYWFTVEFGLCKEGGSIKAYGAGLLSAYGELQHAFSDKPRLMPFEPEKTAIQPYQDVEYQDVYFVADSFNEAKVKIREYVCNNLHRQYDVIYDPYTESVQKVNALQQLENAAETMKSEMVVLTNILRRFKHV